MGIELEWKVTDGACRTATIRVPDLFDLNEWSLWVRPPVHPYQWYWQVSLVNDVADGDPFLTVTNGYAPDLESAKLAAVEAWRRWARETAEAAGFVVTDPVEPEVGGDG